MLEEKKEIFFHKCEQKAIKELFDLYCISDNVSIDGNFCKVEVSGECLSVEVLLYQNGFEPVDIRAS